MNLKIKKEFFYILFLSIFSLGINQYYGYQGILPIDSFLIFNAGFDLLNGKLPFNDYWTIKEPFIDFLQASFFKFFGVSWFTYVLHASFFNFLVTISTFYILSYFKLKTELSFFYSLGVAILTYPTAGTPFSDHHTLIFCLLAIYLFFIAIKTNNNFFWFIIPFILGLSFLSKQAPTVYLVLIISFLSLIYFVNKKNYKAMFYSSFGVFIFILLFFFSLYLNNIQFNDFLTQYILFPKSLGGSRLDWVFPLEFQRFVLRFKIHYLSIIVLFFILINSLVKKIKINLEDILIMSCLILTCILFIFHQLMTINAIFIYCLIPIFCAFSHIYSDNFFKKKYISNFLVILTFCSTCYYFITYVHNRTFMDLRKVDLSKSIDGGNIDVNLKGINWITIFYPNNPILEADNIKFAVNILKNDNQPKMLITDYQFISVFLNKYDNSVTRFWYDFHGYPTKENPYFDYWKNFVIQRILDNKIKHIYVLGPLLGEKKPLENIFDNCFIKEKLSKTFYRINLTNC